MGWNLNELKNEKSNKALAGKCYNPFEKRSKILLDYFGCHNLAVGLSD
jgi:hypothetical protein